MIYFCHIPKTSGSSIVSTIYENLFNILKIADHRVAPLNTSEKELKNFLFNCKEYDIISGHYAATPYDYCPDLTTFSVIREPIERIISCFRFQGNPMSWHGAFPEVFYDYLKNKNSSFKNSIGFNGMPNMQCANLTQKLKWNNYEEYPVYLESPNCSFDEILNIIKKQKITLSTFENRDYLFESLNNVLSQLSGKNISLDKEKKVNINPLKFENNYLTEDIVSEVKALNALDYQLYNYVKDHEIRTGRSLTPDDILF
jgi:hypothetical protein